MREQGIGKGCSVDGYGNRSDIQLHAEPMDIEPADLPESTPEQYERAKRAGRGSKLWNQITQSFPAEPEPEGVAGKIHASVHTLVPIVQKLKQEGKLVAFSNGCFDILHVGHLRYLQEVARVADILIVGVNADASITRLKGADRPINPLADRLEMLAGLACVDYVVPFAEDTPRELITSLLPDLLVKGADWSPDQIVGGDAVRANGGWVRTIALVDGKSTTSVIDKILATGSKPHHAS